MTLVLFFSSTDCHSDITTGLVGWWKFDEGTGTSTTADSSGKGNAGNLENSPSWVTGKIGPFALSFNGSSQYVSAPIVGGQFITSSTTVGTVSAWVYPMTTSGTQLFFSVGENVDSNNAWGCGLFGGDLIFSSNGGGGTSYYSNSGLSVPLDTWSFVACVRESASVVFYVNSSSASGGNPSGNGSVGATNPYQIGTGMQNEGFNAYFNGYIDDVHLYNRALSSSDAAQLYADTVAYIHNNIIQGNSTISGNSIIN